MDFVPSAPDGRITESWNYRMAWFGGGRKDHQTPFLSLRGPTYQLRLPRIPSNLTLNASRDGEFRVLLGAL